MNTSRLLRVGLVAGLVIALGSGTAAQASTTDAVTPVMTGAVGGEPWSAPAYPVDCEEADGQVSCTPTDPARVSDQQCFMGVSVAGESTTVCTTYEGHVQAIQADGGRTLEVKYGCSLGDLVCTTFENAGRGMALAATGMMFLVAQNMRFDTSTVLWNATVDQWSFWRWAVLIILFGAMVWAIAAAIVSNERGELIGALVRTFIAIPATALSLWVTGYLLNSFDQMTWYLVTRDGPDALYSTLQSVMWAGGQANYFFAFLIDGLLMLGMFLLVLVFSVRNIALAALIMTGPVAWMLFPVRGIGPQWVVRYVSAVAVLLLTGPLTIGFLSLIINGLASVKTIWNPQAWPLLVGLVLVAFAPFAIFGLFTFVGAVAADGIGSRVGAHGGRMAASAARGVTRIPSRLGGLPSGVRPAGKSTTSTGPKAAPSTTRTSSPATPRTGTASSRAQQTSTTYAGEPRPSNRGASAASAPSPRTTPPPQSHDRSAP